MLRTTFYFPETLHQRLKTASTRQKKSVSKLAQEILDHALVADEQIHLKAMYKALQEIKGIGQDQSQPQSVDEILYGEDGAWRGTTRLNSKGV